MTVKPISPDEVVTTKKHQIPDKVIEAFNEMIAQNFARYSSTFKQKDVVKLIITKFAVEDKKSKKSKRNEIYDKGWLDIEDIYRAQGWDVEYDKPGYSAYFIFSKKYGKEL